MNNIKKLTLYCLDCIKSTGKNTAFNNLKKNKDDKIIITNETIFNADNVEINEIMTKYALNKTTMSLLSGYLMTESNNIYTPLLYAHIELIRQGDKIEIVQTNDYELNYGLISSLLENNEEIIENVINELMQIDEPEKIDIISVLKGLIPSIDDLTIKDEKAIILTKTPESIAGVVDELKQIAELY